MAVKAGEIYWEMVARNAGVKAGVNEAVREVDKGAKSIGQILREAEKEARLTGGRALENAFRDPMRFLDGAGLGKVGLGVVAVEAVTRQLDQMAERIKEIKVGWSSIPVDEKAYRIASVVPILGDIARAVSGIVSIWGDVGDSVEEVNKRLETQKRLNAETAAIERDTAAAQKEGRGYQGKTYPGSDNPLAAATDEWYDKTQEIIKKRNELQFKLNNPTISRMNGRETKDTEDQIDALTQEQEKLNAWYQGEGKRYQDKINKASLDAVEANMKARHTAENDASDKEIQFQKERDDQLRTAQENSNEKELESQGKHLEAQIAAIKFSYAERIRLAKSEGEKLALIDAEAAEERIAEIEDAKRTVKEQNQNDGQKTPRVSSTASLTGLKEAFDSIQRSAYSGGGSGDLARDTLTKMTETVTAVKKGNQLQHDGNEVLKDVAKQLKQGVGGVFGP